MSTATWSTAVLAGSLLLACTGACTGKTTGSSQNGARAQGDQDASTPAAGTGGSASMRDAASAGSAGSAAIGAAGSGGSSVVIDASAGSGGSAGSAAGMRDAGVRDAGMRDAGNVLDSGSDAGAPDPSNADPLSTDRTLFFGASRCASADVRFCEDFEARTTGQGPDPARWSVYGSQPTIDDVRAARGQKSLHVHTEGNGASLIQEVMTFPATNNVFYGRMFVWFDALPTAPQWAHWTVVAGTGSGDSSEIRVGGQWDGKQNRWGIGTDHGPTGDWTNLDDDPHNAAVPPSTTQWSCVEWLYDGTKNEIRFFLDATEHESLHATETDHGGSNTAFKLPKFDKLGLGWWLYQGSPTPNHYDVWIDEIAIDDERIGCVR